MTETQREYCEWVVKLHVPGEIRSKKNSKRIFTNPHSRKKIVIPTEAYEKWRIDSQKWVMVSIDKQMFPIKVPLSVEAMIYYKGNRPDLSGAMESIGDCFEGCLWENDKLIMSWDGTRLEKDNAFPRIEMVLRW